MLLMKVELKICAASFDNSLAYVHWFWTTTYKLFSSLQYYDVTVAIKVEFWKLPQSITKLPAVYTRAFFIQKHLYYLTNMT